MFSIENFIFNTQAAKQTVWNQQDKNSQISQQEEIESNWRYNERKKKDPGKDHNYLKYVLNPGEISEQLEKGGAVQYILEKPRHLFKRRMLNQGR